MDNDEYEKVLSDKLGRFLRAGLLLVARAQPTDPIGQLGTHMRHMATSDDDSVDNWRLVNIIDSWADLTRKHGTVLKWWHVARTLRAQSAPVVPVVENRKAWKTVRVFVSSTFRDMFCEREWLVKRVFPALRTWCAQRKLFLVECDLRWGVPKDSTSRATLAACLNEIDRCRAENHMPYFVGLLGHRYGWVPSEDDFPEDLRRTYCWMPGMSVTATELFTGSIWDTNPNSILMMRDDWFIEDSHKLGIEEAELQKVLPSYLETSEEQITALETLKKCIQETLPSDQVAQYTCEVNGLIPDGSYRLNITGLQKFGDDVLAFLKQRIQQQYVSVSDENQSNMEIQHDQHEQFMVQKGAVLFGRAADTEAIMSYVNQTVERDSHLPILLVSGSAGTGKSAIIANVANQSLKTGNNKVVFHFVGATPGSTTLYRVLMRLWFECAETPEERIPTDPDELKRSLEAVFRQASELVERKGLDKLVLFIDAINQLDDEGDTLSLLWLPKSVPHNVRVIVSTLEGSCLDTLRACKLPEVAILPLTDESRREIVEEYLKNFNKKLSSAQLDALLSRPDSGRPLWLALASEELRVFGTFEFLDEKIASLAGDLRGLEEQIIERVIADSPVGGDLMQAALSLIRVSRFGLVESELRDLLAIEPTLPEGGKLASVKNEHEALMSGIDKLPMQVWAILYLELRQFLRPVGSSGDGRLDFYHRSISKVVKTMMLQSESAFEFWRKRLAEYFDHHVQSYARKAEELPYHLIALQDLVRLEQVLTDYQMFEQLYKEDIKLELLRFCRQLGGYQKAAEAYLEAFKRWTADWISSQNGRRSEKTIVIDAEPMPLRQFVKRVVEFSSQLSDENGAADNLIGSKTAFPIYGDNESAWTPAHPGTNHESVVVEFEKAVYASAIVIYETFHAGGINRVSAQDEAGTWHVIYEADIIRDIQRARRFRVKVQRKNLKTNRIRLEIDQSVCKETVQIDAIALIGFETPSEVEDRHNRDEEQKKKDWIKQWVARVPVVSSDYGTPEWSGQNLIGGHTVYPKFGSNAQAWCSRRKWAQEFVEVEFEKAVFISKIAIYETTDPGAVSRVSVRNEAGEWQPIYVAELILNLRKSRRFCPPIEKPKFKSNALRIDTDQSVLKNEMELDAIAIFGYEDRYVDEDLDLSELFEQEDTNEFSDVEEAAFVAAKIREEEPSLVALDAETFYKYLNAAVKLGWFLVDLGEYESAEKHLRYVSNVCHAKYENDTNMDTKTAKKYAEIYYAMVTLVKGWYLRFSYGDHPVAQYAEDVGNKLSPVCYELHAKYWPRDSLYYGEVVAACSHFERDYRDEVIALFEEKGYKRGLVELYAMKGEETAYEDVAVTRGYHEKSLKLAYSELGKYHAKTARAHQLYGQTLWNRWQSAEGEHTDEMMNESFTHYWTEYGIMLEIYGPDHVQTLRSMEDCACNLDKLMRDEEAAELRENRVLLKPPAPYVPA